MSFTEKRMNILRNRLSTESLDGIYITNLSNVRYLSGFTGSAGSCLITSENAYFITDGRYLTQSQKQVKEMEIIVDTGTHSDIIKKNNLIKNGLSLGYEGDTITVNNLNRLNDTFPNTNWRTTSQLVEKIASVKDEAELRALQTAVEITDEVFEQIIPELRIGAVERDIAAKISYTYKILGADGDSFDPIVASGINSALPHSIPGDKKLEDGDFVVMDFGALYQGYHADMTRTVVIGTVTQKHQDIYDTVKVAQQQGCDAARTGITCKELDSVTRDYITEKGYGDYFGHGTGHGLGLDVHTLPKISQISEEILEENNVVTIEPGIYIPGWGGVRIEDDVVVKKEKSKVLNKSTKELLVLN